MARRYRVLAARAARMRRRAERTQRRVAAVTAHTRCSVGGAAGERGLGISGGDIEVALLDAATHLNNCRPSLSDRVGDVFPTASTVRKLLAGCQDLIEERFGCRVGLASGSDEEASSLTSLQYGELAEWIAEKIMAR